MRVIPWLALLGHGIPLVLQDLSKLMRLVDMRVLLTSFVPILGAVVTKRRV
jgi:hypothetical protein